MSAVHGGRDGSSGPAGAIHRDLTRRYVLALSVVAALALASHLALVVLVSSQSGAASQIDDSGRQRMLTQRVALQAQAYVDADDAVTADSHLVEMVQSAQLLRTSQRALVEGDASLGLPGDPSPAVLALVEPGSPTGLSARVEAYTATAEALTRSRWDTAGAQDLADDLLLQQATLLPDLDAVVQQYQAESEASVAQLSTASTVLLGLTLLVLLLEALLVFRPAAARLAVAVRSLLSTTDRLRATVDNALVGVLSVEHERVVEANETACSLLQAASGRLTGRHLADLVATEDSERVRELLRDAARGDVRVCEATMTAADGSTFAAELSASPTGRGSGVVVVVVDIAGRRTLELELRRQTLHDGLTGLPNRALLMDRLARCGPRLQRTGQGACLLMCDLDRFQAVTAQHGYALGDALLQELARRLQGAVRENDTVARIGGDRFVVLLEDTGSAQAVTPVAERVLRCTQEPFLLAGHEVQVGLSVGLAVLTGPDVHGDELLRRADVALEASKRAGRGRLTEYAAP